MKIPTRATGINGPIRVRRVEGCTRVEHNSDDVLGTWDAETRTIDIRADLPAVVARRVFFHEMTHAHLADSGLTHLLTTDQEEALCDAIAAGRLAE